jgi:hypothetical protein
MGEATDESEHMVIDRGEAGRCFWGKLGYSYGSSTMSISSSSKKDVWESVNEPTLLPASELDAESDLYHGWSDGR